MVGSWRGRHRAECWQQGRLAQTLCIMPRGFTRQLLSLPDGHYTYKSRDSKQLRCLLGGVHTYRPRDLEQINFPPDGTCTVTS